MFSLYTGLLKARFVPPEAGSVSASSLESYVL